MDNSGSLVAMFPLVLGQIPIVDSGALGQWLFCAACVAVILNYGISLFRALTVGFARRRGKLEDDYPSQQECDARHDALERKFTALQHAWESNRKDLHARINTIAEGVAFIRGKFE